MVKLYVTIAGKQFLLGEVDDEAAAMDVARNMAKSKNNIELNGRVLIPGSALANAVFEVKDK